MTVGTPPQDQVVILDTGSSDLYFDSSSAATCQGDGPNSCRGGTFDSSKSSSYKVVAQSPAFNTAFGDGSTASGPFAEDTVGIGDVSISGVEFGVADNVNSTTGYAVGLMGLGYSINEASKREYPNIPEVLAASGEIASRLYSVWLNDVGKSCLSACALVAKVGIGMIVCLLTTTSHRRNKRHDSLRRYRHLQVHGSTRYPGFAPN